MKDITPPNYLQNNICVFLCFIILFGFIPYIASSVIFYFCIKSNKAFIYIRNCSAGVTLMIIDSWNMFFKAEPVADFSDTMVCCRSRQALEIVESNWTLDKVVYNESKRMRFKVL